MLTTYDWAYNQLKTCADTKQSLASIHRFMSLGALQHAYNLDRYQIPLWAGQPLEEALAQLVKHGKVFTRRGPGGHLMYTTSKEDSCRPFTFTRRQANPA